jgi:hypothetical protein
LKKTIGGKRLSPTSGVERTIFPDPIKSPETPKRGLKRTIGGAKLSDTDQPGEIGKAATPGHKSPLTISHSKPVSKHDSGVPDRSIASNPGILNVSPVVLPEHDNGDEVAAAEARADERRRALKIELEQHTKPKPKKRRF